MRLSLTKKYILSFLIFGISCFLMISTVTSQLIMKQVILEKASVFYQEGIYMSDQYVGNYFEQQDSQQKFSTVRSQLEALCIYLNARIWLISTDGIIILDSSESTSEICMKKLPDSIPYFLAAAIILPAISSAPFPKNL